MRYVMLIFFILIAISFWSTSYLIFRLFSINPYTYLMFVLCCPVQIDCMGKEVSNNSQITIESYYMFWGVLTVCCLLSDAQVIRSEWDCIDEDVKVSNNSQITKMPKILLRRFNLCFGVFCDRFWLILVPFLFDFAVPSQEKEIW